MASKHDDTAGGRRTSGVFGPRHREIISVFLIILAAVVLRDVYLLQYEARLPYYRVPIVDAAYYDAWAQRVAAGRGYGPMPFYSAPLYPYLLALIYVIAGRNLTLVYLLQEALGVLNVLMVYLLGRRLFGHVSGLIGAALILFYAPLMHLESKLLTETLAITLNLASLLLLMRALDRPGILSYLAAGVMLGLSAICRPVALIMIALVLAWLVFRKSDLRQRSGFRPKHLMVLIAGIALAILPVTARNCFIGKDFALISTNGGMVFAQGNNPCANGVFAPVPTLTGVVEQEEEEGMYIAGKAYGRPVKPSESSSFWFRYAMRFIRQDPGGFAKLVCKKFIWSLHVREPRHNYNLNFEKAFVPVLRYLALPFPMLAGLTLYGFIRSRRTVTRRDSELLALQAISIFVSMLIFSVSSRYRAPSAPALGVFAGFGLAQAADCVRKGDLRAIAAAAVCLVFVLLFSLVPYPIPPVTAEAPMNLGMAYVVEGRPDEGMVYLRQALEMSPDSWFPNLTMGHAFLKKGDLDKAEAYYRKALRLRPDDAGTRLALANTLARQGKFEEAMAYYSDILRTDPSNANAYTAMGITLAKQGKTEQAIREYRTAIRADRYHAVAHYNLAKALCSKGEYAQAWKEVRLAEKYGRTPSPQFLKDLRAKMPEPRN